MRIRPLSIAVAAALTLPLTGCNDGDGPRWLAAVEFIGMPAPTTADEKADVCPSAKIKYVYSDGKNETLRWPW